MNKQEAQELLGKPVEVWTAANGQYVGILEEVLPTRPWRGKVTVTGVLSPAQHYELGAVCRRGFRPGETIEAGNSSINHTDKVGVDYKTILEQSIAANWKQANNHGDSKYIWATRCLARSQEIILKEEIKHLETGEWTFKRCVLPTESDVEQPLSPFKSSSGLGM